MFEIQKNSVSYFYSFIEAIWNGMQVERDNVTLLYISLLYKTEQSCLPFIAKEILHKKIPLGWFALYKLKMFNLTCCEIFFIQNFCI